MHDVHDKTEKIQRLDVPGMPAPWRLWKKLIGADGRRRQFESIVRSPVSDTALAMARSLVDLGLFSRSLPTSENEKLSHFSLESCVSSRARRGLIDSRLLHMAFESGLDPDWNENNNRYDSWATLFAETGQYSCLEVCLAAGTDPQVRNSLNDTALHILIKRASKRVAGLDRNTALDMAQQLLDYGSDINSLGKRKGKLDRGSPVINKAIENGSADVLRWLLERDARVDVVDGYGDYPIHCLAMSNFIGNNKSWSEMAELLVGHGAQVDIQNNRGETPLWTAIAWGNVPAVEWLLDHGADVSIDPHTYRDTSGFEKKGVRPISMLMNTCQNLAGAEPVARRMVDAILAANPNAWDAPTPQGGSVRDWLSSQKGPQRAVFESMEMHRKTIEPPEPSSHAPRLRF